MAPSCGEIPRVQVWDMGKRLVRRDEVLQAQIGLGGSRLSCRLASALQGFSATLAKKIRPLGKKLHEPSLTLSKASG